MLNRVTIAGRLTADPETRATESSVVVTNFSVAVERDYVDQATGKREADFIDVAAWRGLGQFAATYLHKGDLVMVDGRLTVSFRTSKDGVKYRNMKVVATDIYFGGYKRKTAEESVLTGYEPPEEEEVPHDDLPEAKK